MKRRNKPITKSAFVGRLYDRLRARTRGRSTNRPHLYEGLEIMSYDEFKTYCKNSKAFNRLFDEYVAAGYLMKLAPSADRIRSSEGYVKGNLRFITHSRNCSLGRRAKENKLK